ncbi:MAG: sugar phosphate isomerase/epimerase family protein, partial [Christensenellales bacterium]
TAYRARRMEALVKAADFARLAGITDVMTHVGFIPENPATSAYTELLAAVTWVAKAFQERGIRFNFETGQETPITLMRTIWDMGLPNVGVNLDPANLLLYGKANPVDAVSIYGKAIHGVHVKDGRYPTDGRHLGREMPVGEGDVHFDRLIPALQDQGFAGPYIIEREIEGDQQRRDIVQARQVLERYL